LPANRTSNTSVVIFIHGGSFIGGDKSEFTALAKAMAFSGYAVINVNYRLVDGEGLFDNPPKHRLSPVKVKDQVDDIAAIVDYTIGSAKKWVVNPNRIAVAGHSAGGTLALLYSYDSRNAEKIKAVVNIAGALDFLFTDIPNWQFLPPFALEMGYRYTGVNVEVANESHFKAISPLYAANTTKLVPTLNIFPQNNDVAGLPKLDLQTYNRFTTRLNELKVSNEFFFMAGSDHGFSRPGDWQQVVDKTIDYLNIKLK
jgi:acetyl esterase/lipase